MFEGESYVGLDLDATGIRHRVFRGDTYTAGSIIDIFKRLDSVTAVIAVTIEERKKIPWKVYMGRTCTELCRYFTGIDIGLTFNPKNMYKKLLKWDDKRNFKILYHWRRKDGLQ
jgi:hypothetical protein